MKVGILGFPKTGKTTVFNALTGAEISTDKFAGRTGKIHLGVARVRDDRLRVLAEIYRPKKITPATIDYVDVPGFEPGSKGLSAYLAEFRGQDAILHVTRGFEDAELPHVFESVDPARDVEAMEGELLLSDLAVLETRLERLESELKKRKDKDLEEERRVVQQLHAALETEEPLRAREWPAADLAVVRGLALLTLKPLLHVVNLGDDAAGREGLVKSLGLERFRSRPRTGVTCLFGRIEEEISRLSAEDARELLADLGLAEPTADRVAAASYELLDQISFLTGGDDEVRAWPIKRGTVARKAAGRIHSDIERGFIRAELVAYDDLVKAGSWSAARDAGTLRLEGKEYVVQDGDVIVFRFNV
jgi:hypothetical protein